MNISFDQTSVCFDPINDPEQIAQLQLLQRLGVGISINTDVEGQQDTIGSSSSDSAEMDISDCPSHINSSGHLIPLSVTLYGVTMLSGNALPTTSAALQAFRGDRAAWWLRASLHRRAPTSPLPPPPLSQSNTLEITKTSHNLLNPTLTSLLGLRRIMVWQLTIKLMTENISRVNGGGKPDGWICLWGRLLEESEKRGERGR